MPKTLSFADIAEEFRDSFGYVRQDMRAICAGDERVNYTLGLLVGCACEMLAAAGGDRKHPECVLAEVLDPEWKPLAAVLYKALRNGLAHGYDTKHIVVDGVAHQIYMNWDQPTAFRVHRETGRGLVIGTRTLAELMCKKIDELETLLKADADACLRWHQEAHLFEREIKLNRKEEKDAWGKLYRY